MHRCGNSHAPELPPLPLPFPPISEKAYIKNVLEPQILVLKSHFFWSCVFVSGSHQFFFMRLSPKLSNPRDAAHNWRLRIIEDSKLSPSSSSSSSSGKVYDLSYASHNSAISLPSSYPPGNSVRGKSVQTRQLPIDRIWLPNFCNAKMLHRRAMGFCLQKTKTLKQHLTHGPSRPTRARDQNLPDT